MQSTACANDEVCTCALQALSVTTKTRCNPLPVIGMDHPVHRAQVETGYNDFATRIITKGLIDDFVDCLVIKHGRDIATAANNTNSLHGE